MNKAALFGLLWLLDLQLKWTQRNKEFWTKHQREIFKIGAASRPISYSQISPSAAESLQELVASGPMRAGKRWVDGWGVSCFSLAAPLSSFSLAGVGCGVSKLSPRTWRSGTEPESLTRRGRRWGGEKEEVGTARASRSCPTGLSSLSITPPTQPPLRPTVDLWSGPTSGREVETGDSGQL